MKKIGQVTLVALLVVLSVVLYKACRSDNFNENDLNAISSDMEKSKDKNGKEVASIKIIESEETIRAMAKKDSTIRWLNSLIETYKGKLYNATVLSNHTTINGGSKTVIEYDTIKIDSMIYVYPVYKTNWKDNWTVGEITAGKDSIFRNITVKNEFEITQGKASNGWFKKRTLEVSVKNLNPYTYTDELRTFKVDQSQKRFTFGVQAGYGFNLLNLQPVPYLGIGFNYTFLGIK